MTEATTINSSTSRDRARTLIALMFTFGVLLPIIGGVVFANSGETDKHYADDFGQAIGVILMSFGGAVLWFATTAWAVWIGVQAARHD